MRWGDLRRSTNVQSRGGGGGLLIGGGGIGALLIAGLVFLMGGDPSVVLQQGAGGGQAPAVAENDPRLEFSARVLGSTEDVWSGIFQENGGSYRPTTLVSYVGGTDTRCGPGQAAMGPFYCPADQGVYIDLRFYEEMERRLGGGGDFAQAYVIAHEVGHHVQNLTGATRQADRLGTRGETSGSVRLELQADCYAGVWAARANRANIQKNGRPLIEPGDLEEGMRTASAIGDDTLQQQQGRVSPESFTHGSSEQRMRWLRRGLETGDPNACDTFSARQL